MKELISIVCISILFIGLESCGDPDPSGGTNSDNFDREALLTDLADNVIIPGYEKYTEELIALDQSIDALSEDLTVDNLFLARIDFRTAYLAWQRVSMFEIGRAELINLRSFTNIFPTNTQEIEANILLGDYNLELPSKFDEQGFPAIDYLLYGVGSDDSEILAYFEENEAATQYLNEIVDRLVDLTSSVRDDWKADYRAEFIGNSGTSATSSLNKLVNDYLFYYEKFLRAGKIGIPAGVFSGSPLPNNVEGLYSKTDSKFLFLSGLEASRAFFIGTSANNDSVGESLKTYLDYLDDGQNLSQKILDQFQAIHEKANLLDASFSRQIEMDNIKMLETYDELQKNVVYLKVDMLQALNIKVDFVDADGD